MLEALEIYPPIKLQGFFVFFFKFNIDTFFSLPPIIYIIELKVIFLCA